MATATIDSRLAWSVAVTWINRRYWSMPSKLAQGSVPDESQGACGASLVAQADDELGPTLKLVRVYFVEVCPPGEPPIMFRVNRRKGRSLSFTDPREASTGTAGTTGIWGTRAPLRAVKPRSLTPTAFRLELTRLVGADRAEEALQAVRSAIDSARVATEPQTPYEPGPAPDSAEASIS